MRSHEDYENPREELKKKLTQIRGPNGKIFENRVFTPEELYGIQLATNQI